MRRKSLLWHIFLPFLAVVVVSLVLVTAYTSRSLRGFFYEQTAADLADRARLMREEIAPLLTSGDGAAIQTYCRDMGMAANVRVTVIRPDGVVAGDSQERPDRMDNHGARPEILAALGGQVGQAVRYSATLGHQRMYVALPVETGALAGVVRTSHSLASIDRALTVVQQRIALGGLLLALAAAAVSYGMARRISGPLRQMKTVAERYAAGDLDARLATIPDSEEVGALAEALTAMGRQLADRIGTIENQRNEQQAVLGSMVESVIAIDGDETIIGINDAGRRLLDVGAAAEGHALPEVVRNPDLIDLARAALAGGEPVEGEIVLRQPDDRHLQVHATGLRSQDGRRLGALLVLNDVTRMRRLESVRRDFVANVSHELRTPITSIKGFLETLRDDPPADPEAAARFLAIVARQADRLQAIVDDLMMLSRLEQNGAAQALNREDIGLRELLEEAATVCRARAGADAPEVRIDCAADLRLRANPALLEQAVINLLDNALKYSGATEPVVAAGRREDGRVVISVTDRGRGIGPAHLPRIFERFYRVDRARSRDLGGTGLGLAIVKHIAQAHGGEVTVASTPGEGSTFTIVLPAAPSATTGERE